MECFDAKIARILSGKPHAFHYGDMKCTEKGCSLWVEEEKSCAKKLDLMGRKAKRRISGASKID